MYLPSLIDILISQLIHDIAKGKDDDESAGPTWRHYEAATLACRKMIYLDLPDVDELVESKKSAPRSVD